MVGVYFLPPLEWGLEEARTVSELFPARAPAPGTGPGTGSTQEKLAGGGQDSALSLCDEACTDWDRSVGSGAVTSGRGKNRRSGSSRSSEQDGTLSDGEELGGALLPGWQTYSLSIKHRCPLIPAVCPSSPTPGVAWLFAGLTQISPRGDHWPHGVCETPKVAQETSHACSFVL